jgi:hypothetical protein
MAGLPNHLLPRFGRQVISGSGSSVPKPEQKMSIFNRLMAVVEAFATANPFSTLMSLSDTSLNNRGMYRDDLPRTHIAGTSAR